MKKFAASLMLALSLGSFAHAGVLKTAYKGVKATPKAVVKVAKVALKVVF